MTPYAHWKLAFTFVQFAIAIVLLVVSSPSVVQAAEPVDLPPNPPPSKPKYPRLDSQLNQMVEQIGKAAPQGIAGGAPLYKGTSVAVTVRLSGNVADIEGFLRSGGATVANVGTDYIEAYVPITLLETLANQKGMLRVQTIIPPHPDVTSQGASVHGSPIWNAAGFTGAGIKVGIIDVGFIGYSGLMGTELPSTVVARCYTAVGSFTSNLADCQSDTKHGTAVAEAVVDIAPNVSLYIANPFSPGDLQSTASWMISQGVKVINQSLHWVWEGPGDGTSPFSDSALNSVNLAVSGGAIWLNSAGNAAKDNWYGTFSDADSDRWLEFIPGVPGEVNAVQLTSGETFTAQLRWEDNWGNASRDFNLYLLNSSLSFVASSTDEQSGVAGQYPLEWLIYTPSSAGTYYLAIWRFAGAIPSWLQLNSFYGQDLTISTPNNSIDNPAESANAGLLAVGAANWATPDTIESFSSRGPTTDGRTKPDIVGADRGDSVSYGSGAGAFSGTSQASPHVAGLAALVLQRFPAFTPDQVATYLKSNALPRGAVPNNTWGSGLAHLPSVAILDPLDTTKALAWGRQGGSIVLEVRDADLDVAKVITGALNAGDACSTAPTKCENATVTAGAADSTTLIVVANKPILDRNSDGLVNVVDVDITDTADETCLGAVCNMIQAIGVDASNGVITIKRVSTLAADKVIRIRYNSAAVDTVGSTTLASSVKVTSNADPVGIGVVLTETTASSGIFRAILNLVSGASNASSKNLMVSTNDMVNLLYTDSAPTPETVVSTTIPVESFVPVFSNFSPVHKTSTQVSRPEIGADVTDADSGVKKTSIKVVWGIDSNNDSVIDTASEDIVDSAGGTVDTITGGYRIKQRITGTVPTTDFQLFWWIAATDTAGNFGVSDRAPMIDSTTDTCSPSSFPSTANLVGKNASGTLGSSAQVAGCQPFLVRIDYTAPVLSSAFTGRWWDTTITATDKTQADPTKAKNTSIMVNFNEDMDGTTVDASDFTVGGVTPSAAAWYSDKKSAVFLTVSALAADARPVVRLVGSVRDAAGNIQTSGEVTSGDGIAPTTTVTITGSGTTGTIPVTKDKITIQFNTDEDVTVDSNTVTVKTVTAAAGVLGVSGANISTLLPTLVGTRTWRIDVTPPTIGLFNVYVTATDVGGFANVGTIGHATNPASTRAILFEKDAAVPPPDFSPASTNDPNTPIFVDFTKEGKEYGLDSSGNFTTVIANVSTSKDTHKSVTLTSATLDGVDILSQMTTTDSIVFRYNVSGLTFGGHTIRVRARDEAGNEMAEASHTFNVAYVPTPPTNVTAIAGIGQATVSWTAPSSNGGSAITQYTVTSNPGNFTATVNGSMRSATVTGLVIGTTYTFTVTATNAVGSSSPSASSNSVIPTAPTVVPGVSGPGLAIMALLLVLGATWAAWMLKRPSGLPGR